MRARQRQRGFPSGGPIAGGIIAGGGRIGDLVKRIPNLLILSLLLVLSADAQADLYSLQVRSTGAWVVGPADESFLDLLPQLKVSYFGLRGPVTETLSFNSVACEATRSGFAVHAHAQSGTARYYLAMYGSPSDPRLLIEVRSEYEMPAIVRYEVLRFTTGRLHSMKALDRAYRWRPVSSRSFVGPLTPHQATLQVGRRSVSLMGTQGVQGYWIRARGGGRYLIGIELDHADNHPLVKFRECRGSYNGPKLPRDSRNDSQRMPGMRRVYHVRWRVGQVRLPAVQRYPKGYRASLIFTDHADQSSASRLEAFAFGHTGALREGRVGNGNAGFVNRGLSYTKTIFLRPAPSYDAQFDSPTYRAVLAKMEQKGVEIGLHSVSGGPDLPETIDAALAEFREHHRGRTWIDHQPLTNCEAVTNLGSTAGNRWYSLPTLHRYGFRYLWSGHDVNLPRGQLNLLRPESSSRRVAVIYPAEQLLLKEETPFVLFSSTWLFYQRQRTLRLLAPPALDRLEQEHGICIAHVYLDTYRDEGWLRGRELLERVGPDAFRLRPEVDAAFHHLARRQRAGRLWVTGLEAVAGHLRRAMRVHLSIERDGSVVVRHPDKEGTPLRGLTLRMPEGVKHVRVDGVVPMSQQELDGHLEVWFDLPAGGQRRVQPLGADGSRVSLAGWGGVRLDAP